MEYAYAYSGKEAAILIIRVDHVDEAISRILTKGGTLLEAKVFSSKNTGNGTRTISFSPTL